MDRQTDRQSATQYAAPSYGGGPHNKVDFHNKCLRSLFCLIKFRCREMYYVLSSSCGAFKYSFFLYFFREEIADIRITLYYSLCIGREGIMPKPKGRKRSNATRIDGFIFARGHSASITATADGDE